MTTFRVIAVPVRILSRLNMTGMIRRATGLVRRMAKQECAARELHDIQLEVTFHLL